MNRIALCGGSGHSKWSHCLARQENSISMVLRWCAGWILRKKTIIHLKNRMHSSRLHRMVISHQKHTRGWCKTPTTSNTVWWKICYSCVVSTSLGWTMAECSRHTSLQLVEAQSQTVLSPPPPPLTCKSNLIWQTFMDKAAWKNTHTHTHIQWPSLQQSWITISKCVHKKQDNH